MMEVLMFDHVKSFGCVSLGHTPPAEPFLERPGAHPKALKMLRGFEPTSENTCRQKASFRIWRTTTA